MENFQAKNGSQKSWIRPLYFLVKQKSNENFQFPHYNLIYLENYYEVFNEKSREINCAYLKGGVGK